MAQAITTSFEGQRIGITTSRSFDDLLARLRQLTLTMIRDDLTAGLFAPVEILLVEGENGNGCTAAYVLPSSVVAAANPSLLPAARQLDRKLDGLISGATGVAKAHAVSSRPCPALPHRCQAPAAR